MFSARTWSENGVSLTLSGGVRASERFGVPDESRAVGLREEQELIFDRFFQSPSSRLSRRGAGQIPVVSEPGLGSTFWVTMPAASVPVRQVGDMQEVAS